MKDESDPLLARIARALERLAPADRAPPDFAAARLFRYDPRERVFIAAPDYALPVDLLVGVDRQKARFIENLSRFARGLPANHVLLWGVAGDRQELAGQGRLHGAGRRA